MQNAVISEIFNQMADIMEILGEDRFRINTYRRVARTIVETPTDAEELLASGELAKIPGIGKSSIAKIQQFIQTGQIEAHQQLLGKIPTDLLELLKIPGMGPKGVKAVYENLNVTSITELKDAIDSGKFAQLPGFGDKKAASISRGIEFLKKSAGRIRIDQALFAAAMVTDLLASLPGVEKIKTAGSLRRLAETIGDVDILVTAKNGSQIIKAFTQAEFVEEILAAGPTKGSVIIKTQRVRVQVDVRVVGAQSLGAAAQYFTGSKEHNIRLREIAVKAKLKLNEYGLFKDDKPIAGSTEEEIYKKLGLEYIEPILREDRGEVEAAQQHTLPEIIEPKDIKGDFHVHTNASDGDCDLEQIVRAAADQEYICPILQKGPQTKPYDFICITDHSRSSVIANGLSAEQLKKQIKQIRKLNDEFSDITIFAGSEVDILADGSLDFEDALLADLDFVIASIHSGMTGPREKVTMRLLKAMDNPYVNCLAHPTGRLLGQREPMDIDIPALIKHAAQTNTALEVNANPWRLDLKDTNCKMAIENGVKLTIGTDAHSISSLGLMPFGVATAARGWATKNDIINTFSTKKLKNWLKKKRPR